jgi:uncharacterized protein YjbI with pentapeptide repeats
MVAQIPCAKDGCDRLALSDGTFCAAHHPDPGKASEAAISRIRDLVTIKDLNASGLRAESLDLSQKRFFACLFEGVDLRRVVLSGCVFRMCVFDFSSFSSCDFSRADIQFCSFAGSSFVDSSFEACELVHVNMNGVRAADCTFNDSNLYNSRFINAELTRVDIENCNVKKAFFLQTRMSGVSFKSSNTQEAVMGIEGPKI